MKIKITTYEILIYEGGTVESIVCQNKREMRKTLFEYFTHKGRIKMWNVWYELYHGVGSYEKWLKHFIKTYRMTGSMQIYRLGKNHFIIVKKKEKIIKR